MITFLYQSRDITKPVTQEKTFWDGTRYYHGYYGSGGDFITSPKISQVIRPWCFGVYLIVICFFHNGPKRQDAILSDLLNWDLVEGL